MRAQIPREIAGGWAVVSSLVALSLLGCGRLWAVGVFWEVDDWRPGESSWGPVGFLWEKMENALRLVLELWELH